MARIAKALAKIETSDLDEVHKERVDAAYKRLRSGGSKAIASLFLSERVSKTISEQKAFIASYDVDKILSLLPFWKNVYVEICPYCLNRDEAGSVEALVTTGAIVPVLTAPYRKYDDRSRRLISSHDHLSFYEFQAYRTLSLMAETDQFLCGHCAGERRDEVKAIVKSSKKLSGLGSEVDLTMANLHPYVFPDFELMDLLKDASKRDSVVRFRELTNLSWAINACRTAQAFDAALVLDEPDLSKIPTGVAIESDKALQLAARIQKQAADGLGLVIPKDIPIESYVEIAREFQPQIALITRDVMDIARGSDRQVANSALLKQVMGINTEIERIKGLKRYAFLEAAVGFYADNRTLATATLIAGALGVAGGIIGCATGLAIGVGRGIAKKKGWIPANKKMERFGELVRRDVQPYLNKLIASYVGSTVPAVSILAMRHRIGALKAR